MRAYNNVYMKDSPTIRNILRRLLSIVLRHSPSERLSDFLLWPVSRRLFGSGYTEIVNISDTISMRVYGDMRDMVNKTLLFMSKYQSLAWEPVTARLVDLLAPNALCVVVAGAHIGYYPLIISGTNANAIVYAFEPDPRNYERLVDNLKLNNALNVRPLFTALGDTVGQQTMYFDSGQSSLVNTNRPASGSGTVSVMTLDEVFKDKVDLPDLMIFDAEGYEPQILLGAASVIDRASPDIIFEINPKALCSAGSTPDKLCAMLSDRGYALFIVEDNYTHDLSTKFDSAVKLRPYEESLVERMSFVNAFATLHPERFRQYIMKTT